MSDELNNVDGNEQPPFVIVQNDDGTFHQAILAPEPEPQLGGEVESVVAASEPLEIIETVPVDAVDATPDTTPTPPKPIPPANMLTPEELAEHDSETVRLVSAQESAVCQLESDLASLKDEAKAAKKAVESAKEELRELIQNRDRQRGRKPAPSLFDAPAHNATATTTNRVDEDNAIDQVNDQAAATREPEPVDPHAELWREYPMTFTNWKPFGLTAKDIERLNSGETKDFGTHPIRVLGDITRFITPNEQSPGFTRSLMDFKGFGEKSYDRWLSAESAFWDWWNNKGGKQAFADEQAGKVNAA